MAEADPNTPLKENVKQHGTDGKSIWFCKMYSFHITCVVSCEEEKEDTSKEKYATKDLS